MSYPMYELLDQPSIYPPIASERRRNLAPGDVIRICVLVGLDHIITPHVEIVEPTPTGYVCVVSSAMGSDAWLPYHTRIVVTFDQIIECDP